jgi:hypothetical protein
VRKRICGERSSGIVKEEEKTEEYTYAKSAKILGL